MKFIELVAHAYANGRFCSPADGVVQVADDEAERLIAAGLGTDVTDDFADPAAEPKPAAGAAKG